MTPAQHEQRIFWSIFEKKLQEIGNPFSICYEFAGKTKYFASVDKKNAMVSIGLTIDFLYIAKIVKINIYIENDLQLFNELFVQKEQIEKELGFAPKWILNGVKNPNTRRIISTFPVIIGNPNNYEMVINKVIPYVIQYKNVFIKRIPNLFDFKANTISTNIIPPYKQFNESHSTISKIQNSENKRVYNKYINNIDANGVWKFW